MKELGIIDFDGRAVRAAVVRLDRPEIVRRTPACPTVAELGSLPRHCVVRSTEVATALVQLPEGKRSAAEMAQLLRWELEPQLATQEQFDSADSDYAVGWALQGDSACRAVAMGRKRRRWWREQLAACHVRLIGIYPLQPDGDADPLEVALHAAGRIAASHGVAVPARDPGAPLRQRPVTWWAAALIVLGLLALGLNGLLDRSRRIAESELAQAREPWERVDREVRALRARNAAAGEIRAELEQLELERARLERRSAQLESGPAHRARFVAAVLDALAKPATGEVVIDRVAERLPGKILVEGCAVSERAVQVYTRAVAALVSPLGVQVVGSSARAAERNYAFSFLLTPIGGA
jgi:hypothetical protein